MSFPLFKLRGWGKRFAVQPKPNCSEVPQYNMTKAGYTVHVISDCVTSYDLKKVDEMLDYYAKKGCEVKPLSEYMN